MISRSSKVLALFIALTAAMGLPASADTTIRLGLIPSILSAQAYYAEQLGYFKKRGLDVQLQPMNNGAAMASAVAGGSLDIAFAEPVSLGNGDLHGLHFVYIASGIMNTPAFPAAGLLVRADLGINDAKSLNGKTIAVNAINTLSSISTQSWIDANGGDAKSVKFVELPLPQMTSAVDAGTVQAAYAGEPFFTIAKNRGMKVVTFTRGAPAATYMASGWFADQAWVEKNRTTAIAFAEAVREAAAWANANRPAAATLLEAALKLPEGALRNLSQPFFFDEAPVQPALIQPILDAALKYNALAKPVRAEDLIAKLK